MDSSIMDIIVSIVLPIINTTMIFITCWFIILQVIEMRRTTHAQAYGIAREILQDEKVRAARKTIFNLGEKATSLNNWTQDEIRAAEIVCHTYDTVGQMIRNKLLPIKYIIDSWGPSLRKSWPIVSPLVIKDRDKWDAIEAWDDYEWLFIKATKLDTKRRKCKIRLEKIKSIFISQL